MRLATFAVLAGCGSSVTPAPHDSRETHDFHGATYTTPAGVNIASAGNELPGPDVPGAAPPPVFPAVAIILPNQHRFYVTITKEPSRVALDGTRAMFAQQPQASDFAGTTAAHGFDATYRWKTEGAAPPTTVHLHVVSLPDADYQCQYDDDGSPDGSGAAAICASIAAKPPA